MRTRVVIERFDLPMRDGKGWAVRWAESHHGRRLTVATGFSSRREAVEWVQARAEEFELRD